MCKCYLNFNIYSLVNFLIGQDLLRTAAAVMEKLVYTFSFANRNGCVNYEGAFSLS